jgi:peptidoglycan/xylan/chitin deacetylase (PgdA/CDA1 family)
MADTVSYPRGVFTLSLDFELIWGTLDLFGPSGFARACEIERTEVIDRLLALLAEYEVPATWCILGHLFLDHCPTGDSPKHAEIVRPQHAWHPADWFASDPGGTESTAPLFFGRSLVEKIRSCPAEQEIGSHSFSHVIFGDPGCSAETASTELAECVRLAGEMGIELRSFAFPRNQVGHLDILRQHGFSCFRGPEPNWYEADRWPEVVQRLGRLIDVLRIARPPVVLPRRDESGLWDIPGSAMYFPMHGGRRFLPLSWRVRRAVKGLNAAARERRVFHLWFHPTNLADQTESMFAGLRSIFAHARKLRDRGELDLLPMGKLAA